MVHGQPGEGHHRRGDDAERHHRLVSEALAAVSAPSEWVITKHTAYRICVSLSQTSRNTLLLTPLDTGSEAPHGASRVAHSRTVFPAFTVASRLRCRRFRLALRADAMAFCSVRTAVLDHGEAVAIAPAALSVVMPREMRRDSLLKGTELILHGIELFVHLIDLKTM